MSIVVESGATHEQEQSNSEHKEREVCLDFSRNQTDPVDGGSAAERLFQGGSKCIASFFTRGRKSVSVASVASWTG